jgi:hypothetical protein
LVSDAFYIIIYALWKRLIAFVSDVIICQSAVRRHNAVNTADYLRQEKEEARRACAGLIQRAWRAYRIREIHSNMVNIQQMEKAAATKLSAQWRRFVCEEEYRLTLIGKSTPYLSSSLMVFIVLTKRAIHQTPSCAREPYGDSWIHGDKLVSNAQPQL